MDFEHAAVLFATLGLLTVAAVLVLASPVIIGDGVNGIQESRLAAFETTEPYCGDPNVTSETVFSEDIPGGERLYVNRTIPVAGPNSEIRAGFDSWGPGRHTLALTRPPGNATETGTPTETDTGTRAGTGTSTRDDTAVGTSTATEPRDCDYVVRYNATLEFARETDWTLLITYDGELVAAHWHDGAAGGSFETSPTSPTAGNRSTTGGNAT